MNQKYLAILFTIIFLPFILLLSFNMTFLTTHTTPDQQNVFNYLTHQSLLPEIYNEQEASHFQDVKNILLKANILAAILYTFILAIFIYYLKSTKPLASILLPTGKITLTFLILFLLLIMFKFNFLFNTIFHPLLFPQGNWTFPSNSTIIQIFPQDFFISFALRLACTSLLFGFFTLVTGLYLKRHH